MIQYDILIRSLWRKYFGIIACLALCEVSSLSTIVVHSGIPNVKCYHKFSFSSTRYSL
jgi:hypothetical protein